MVRTESARKRHTHQLIGFADYEAFVQYVHENLKLKPDEVRALYDVLVKLQSVGQDPVNTLEACRRDMAPGDCLDMLRFMMYIDGLDLGEIKTMA